MHAEFTNCRIGKLGISILPLRPEDRLTEAAKTSTGCEVQPQLHAVVRYGSEWAHGN